MHANMCSAAELQPQPLYNYSYCWFGWVKEKKREKVERNKDKGSKVER
jgi:hypothetical protein